MWVVMTFASASTRYSEISTLKNHNLLLTTNHGKLNRISEIFARGA